MTETALRDRENASATAWLMRGRSDTVLLPVATSEPPTQVHEAPLVDALPMTGRRDWSSTLDLIREATAAIRISEERSSELEQELKRTVAQAIEREQALEAKFAKSEVRAELAEKRASEAEEWLARLHEAVVAGFTRTAPEPSQPDLARPSVA
ncbi:hypothetical protein MPOCJGCO_4513 [Methylobacterium trifolii]|uniref:ATPase n=2 Tax=Methylobacterium trifolii TaxID=1003092 RepID=A0ABQ4U4P7_9HYPH|nr:hypothetical protein MPOCJGCO_4513 [Methylobacterium trifolii]